VDASHPSTDVVQKIYFPATVRATSYPNVLAEDVPSFAVKAFLVTYDYGFNKTKQSLARLAQSLCEHFDALRTSGHPKWREVEMTLPDLVRGWFYYAPTAREIRACISSAAAKKVPPMRACSQHERILGLCS
jgi:hypothetical protein